MAQCPKCDGTYDGYVLCEGCSAERDNALAEFRSAAVELAKLAVSILHTPDASCGCGQCLAGYEARRVLELESKL